MNEKTPQEALEKLTKICSITEYCEYDLRQKMYRWSIIPEEQDEIIAYLKHYKYINTRRFVEAYVKDKIHFAGWGPYKIKQNLLFKKIKESIIQDVIDKIDYDIYIERLEKLLKKKLKITTAKNNFLLKQKLMQYAFARGFSTDMTIECLERLDFDEWADD